MHWLHLKTEVHTKTPSVDDYHTVTEIITGHSLGAQIHYVENVQTFVDQDKYIT